MIAYCESAKCRHATLGNYFGDTVPVSKSMCDVCKDPKKVEYNLR